MLRRSFSSYEVALPCLWAHADGLPVDARAHPEQRAGLALADDHAQDFGFFGLPLADWSFRTCGPQDAHSVRQDAKRGGSLWSGGDIFLDLPAQNYTYNFAPHPEGCQPEPADAGSGWRMVNGLLKGRG
jgi:hypothetical protein